MKKVDEEKLIGKTLAKTFIVLLVMFLLAMTKKGYEYPFGTICLLMGKIVLAVAILLLINAAIFVYLGLKKDQKFFEISAWSAGLATLAMLIKINFGSKALISVSAGGFNKYALIHFSLPSIFKFLGTITFYELVILGFIIYVLAIWVYAVVKIIKK